MVHTPVRELRSVALSELCRKDTYSFEGVNLLCILSELRFILGAHALTGTAEIDRGIEIGRSGGDQSLLDEGLAFLDTCFLQLFIVSWYSVLFSCSLPCTDFQGGHC